MRNLSIKINLAVAEDPASLHWVNVDCSLCGRVLRESADDEGSLALAWQRGTAELNDHVQYHHAERG